MGRIAAIFKADGDETRQAYSISEWWLEPHTQGAGTHSHEEDDVFHVIEGTMSFLIGDRWIDASKRSFVLAPGGVTPEPELEPGGCPEFLDPKRFREGYASDREMIRRESSERRLTTDFSWLSFGQARHVP